jgi:hypothetical protein
MKQPSPQLPLTLLSPSKRIRAELSVETVWIGPTVYPECPVWRVWCDERPVVDTSTVGVMTEGGPLAYGMRFVKATRHRPQTGIGPGREIRARFASRDGRELEVRVRVTDVSAFCAVREIGRRPSRAHDKREMPLRAHYEQVTERGVGAAVCSGAVRRFPVDAQGEQKADRVACAAVCSGAVRRFPVDAQGEQKADRVACAAVCSDAVRRCECVSGEQDLSITRFPEGSVLLGSEATLNVQRSTLNAQGEGPHVLFAPSGKLIAFWRHGLEQHAVFFDRPGDLAVRRFGVLERVGELVVEDGRQGCNHLFLTVPFTKAALPAPAFGEAVTPAYRAAFELMLGRGGASDDFRMLRGEPGEFAVAARRLGDVWHVAGVTSDAQTLTVRFEDLWLRMPAELRALAYAVEILRDPLKDESGEAVTEVFADQAPDVRVALDLAKSGGFLITFRPHLL